MTTEDLAQESMVTAAKQEILAKFQGAVLDNPEFSGADFAALLRAVREGDDDDFIETLIQAFLPEESETMEEAIRRIVSESKDSDASDDPPENPLWKGISILGVAIVAAASLFAPIDPEFRRYIVIGSVALVAVISWQ